MTPSMIKITKIPHKNISAFFAAFGFFRREEAGVFLVEFK